jgi:RluA family pseudouridine synthase
VSYGGGAPLSILYESEACLVVAKPSGVATQAPPPFDSLEVRVKDWLRERDRVAGPVYVGVPHRLDRPVSGAILFARHRCAARKLSRQFEKRRVGKLYWAVVQGGLKPETGTWHDFLRKVHGRPQAEIVAAEDPGARPAELRYVCLARDADRSWVEFELVTGRTHQIRIQAARRGCPVWGDRLYGATTDFGPPPADERQRSIALHGRHLSFVDPATGDLVSVTAPLPHDWPTPQGAPL